MHTLELGPDRKRKSKENRKKGGEEHVFGRTVDKLQEHHFDTPVPQGSVDSAYYKVFPPAYTEVIIDPR